MNDEAMIKFAVEELHKLQIIDRAEVIDATMVRMPKAYPAYFGTYPDFRVIREYVDSIENLFLIGRNGMHKYNNQDHSMLTAIMAVDNIISQVKSKDNIWSVNTEEAYHES
jgi:protoporphyrinogen oxidase